MPMDWTPPPRGTGRNEADLKQVVNQLKNKLPFLQRSRGMLLILLLVVAVLLGSTAYFTVGPEETGVVLRFGRYDRQASSGLHFKLPLGIETVHLVKTGRVFKEEFGFRGVAPGARSRFNTKGFSGESLVLSGDLNVIEVKWIVQYRVRDPRLWLFAVADPVASIRDLSEAVIRGIVGDRYSDEVLTLARVEIANQAQKELQELLDMYRTGVQVVTVKLQDVNPPEPVQPAFNEVNEARQQKERMINEAQEAYNHEVPRAVGEAQRVVTEAEGFATERVNRAQGEARRFNDLLAAYREAKEVTLRRLYLEAMQKVIQNAARIQVVDERIKGILPMLNLDEGAAPAAPRRDNPREGAAAGGKEAKQ